MSNSLHLSSLFLEETQLSLTNRATHLDVSQGTIWCHSIC